jgi:hypothetical protein
MKRSSTIFLQIVVMLVGIGALVFLLRAPLRGVKADATLFEIYFNSFVLYSYVAFIPFFMGLYQTFKLLGYARQNKIFTPQAVKALRTIKYCAMAFLGFVAVSVIFMIGGDPEDRPPGTVMRLVIAFPAIVVATAAATFERILQNAVEIKSENDLTV